jgi:hypothetical protein
MDEADCAFEWAGHERRAVAGGGDWQDSGHRVRWWA